MINLPVFKMPFEPRTVEHLGLNLYNTLPPVIAELVSNAWDADAHLVEIQIPTGAIDENSVVTVRDFGHGMTPEELNDEYLPISRNRRGDDNSQVTSKSLNRMVTGRKGLGKLSAFGIADEVDIRTMKDGTEVTIRLSYPDIKAWQENGSSKHYEPKVIKQGSMLASETSGVEVTVRRLRRSKAIDKDQLERGLARRLNFIGPGFQVKINGIAIGPGARARRSDCDQDLVWDIADIVLGPSFGLEKGLTGWIGFLEKSSQNARGVDIFANQKSAELESFFDFGSTHAQFARAHIIGEIHADFLDDKQDDLISTARNSIVWEHPLCQEFQVWGQALLRWSFDKWLLQRQKKKSETIIKAARFDEWLQARPPREQRIAKQMVNILAKDSDFEEHSAEPLLEIIKASVETTAFRDLISDLEEEQVTSTKLLQLFDEWRVIEAREHLQLADGRRAALEHLMRYIEGGALEVTEMQKLLRENPWILGPNWSEVQFEKHYTSLITKFSTNEIELDEVDRRIDIIAMSEGGKLWVIEIKRPEKTASRKDLEQIESYVDWAKTNFVLTSTTSNLSHVAGTLIVGKLPSGTQLAQKIDRLATANITVETWRDVYHRAQTYFKLVDDRLQHIAPEYTRRRKQKADEKTQSN